MRSIGISSAIRSTVSCSSVFSPTMCRNCFGSLLRDSGQSRVPAPPERTSAYSRGNGLTAEVIELHRVPHLAQRLVRLATDALAAGGEDLIFHPPPRADLGPAPTAL